MKVLVLSMVPDRDWYIDESICHEIRNLGHQAILRKYLQDGRDGVTIEKPDVVLLPVVRCPYTLDFATQLKSWGIKVAARRSEAGVSKRMYAKMSHLQRINQIGRYDYNDCIDMELVWGRQFADILIAEGKIAPDKLRIIGAIALDKYFHPDYGPKVKELGGSRAEFIKQNNFDRSKKTIMWACGFKMADAAPDYNLPEACLGDPIHEWLHARDLEARKVWIETMNILHRDLSSSYNFFVRPHPGEDCQIYRRQLPNSVSVTLERTAVWGLTHCDILIHAGSTLAMDAHILKKPAFNFYGAADDDLVGDISPKCKTAKQLMEHIKNVELGKSNASQVNFGRMEDFCGAMDGMACRRVAQALGEFADVAIQTSIPNRWPWHEPKYEIEGVVALADAPVRFCGTCKHTYQVLNGRNKVPCPHCGIATTLNDFD